MSVAPDVALREKLRNDAALNAFWQSHYGKDAKHLIGYKRSQNANDFPVICYVTPESELGDPSGERVIVSVVIGVNEPGVTDDVFDGVARTREAARLVMAAIAVGTIDATTVWLGQAKIINDGMRHPYYETEIILPLLWRG